MVVLDVLDPVCVYTFVCVEIKTKTETFALRMFENMQTMLVPEDRFFLILSWTRRDRDCVLQCCSSRLCVAVLQ